MAQIFPASYLGRVPRRHSMGAQGQVMSSPCAWVQLWLLIKLIIPTCVSMIFTGLPLTNYHFCRANAYPLRLRRVSWNKAEIEGVKSVSSFRLPSVPTSYLGGVPRRHSMIKGTYSSTIQAKRQFLSTLYKKLKSNWNKRKDGGNSAIILG